VIQKAHIGRGFRGVLNYVCDESAERGHEAAVILETNMAGRNPRELAAEFGAFRQLNPDLTRAVYHCSLRLPEGEHLDNAGWAGFSRDYLQAMGFGEVPYVVVQHAGDHVHLIASRIRFDGGTVPDGNDRWRSNGVVYGLEEKYHLSHARDPERGRERGAVVALDGGEAARAERVREVPPKLRVAVRIDLAVAGCDGTREGFDEVLCGLGVEAQWNVASTGRVHGASFALEGYTGEMQSAFKGSQLGREYAWGRLSARLDARREEQAQGQGREHEREPGRTMREGGGHGGNRREAEHEADVEQARREQTRASVEQGARDHTREAMRGQLAAMGCREYEIGVRDPVRGMLTRRGTASELEARVGWLQAMNAGGADIFVRPAEPGGLVLVDDVGREALAHMAQEGLGPAVITETSPGNHQAWVRLAAGPVTREIGTEAARGLAGRYGGDPRSAEAGHYGRLAGFTNQKPEHARADGRQPYVLLREARGGCAPAGEAALARAGARVAMREGVAKATREAAALSRAGGGGGVSSDALEKEYRERAARLCARYPEADRSRVDWAVTRDLATAYPLADAGMLTAALRTGGHMEDYAARTVGKVLMLPEVVAARQAVRMRDDDRDDR